MKRLKSPVLKITYSKVIEFCESKKSRYLLVFGEREMRRKNSGEKETGKTRKRERLAVRRHRPSLFLKHIRLVFFFFC